MSKLLKYLKEYVLQILLVFIFVFIQVMADLQLPDYMSKIIDIGIIGNDSSIILSVGKLMIFVSLLSGACTVLVGFLSSRIGAGFAMHLRNAVFTKVESFSIAEIDKFSTASLITRSTNDIQQIQMVLTVLLRMFLLAPIMGVGAVIKAVEKSPSMSWIMALAVGSLIAIVVIILLISLPKYKILQKLIDKLNLVTRENLTGLRVIRAFNTQKKEEEKFEKANSDLTNTNLFINRVMVSLRPIMMIIMNITSITVIWVGAKHIDMGNMMIGDIIAFMQYSMNLIMAFLMVTMIFVILPRALVSAGRVAEILETEATIKDPENPIEISEESYKGFVEFKNVDFSYPNAEECLLSDISFTANAGEVTAIIGSTGSGKTTLINLISRFFDVTNGQVLVDGNDVRNIRQSDLREKIGYVTQKSMLFSGTIESNIKYANENAPDDMMIDVAKVSQAYDFIDKFELKYKTPISQGGTNVSGGQKQRLSIARALFKNPKIYIFDDSFSALDFKTDAILRKELANRTKEATVIIVAQRISTIMNADKIIVLEEGKIVGIGTHQKLLKDCKVYKEIALSQLSEEELA